MAFDKYYITNLPLLTLERWSRKYTIKYFELLIHRLLTLFELIWPYFPLNWPVTQKRWPLFPVVETLDMTSKRLNGDTSLILQTNSLDYYNAYNRWDFLQLNFLFLMIQVSTSHVTIKKELKHCEKLISQNPGNLLWIITNTSLIVTQILCRTEVEGDYVETDSTGIMVVWKSWIDDLVRFIYWIPDFRFRVTEKINYQNIITKINLPAVWRPSTNDHNVIFQSNGCVVSTSFCQRSNLSPWVIFEFSDDISGITATNDICCFWCRSSGVCPNLTENNKLNFSCFKYVRGLIKNKTYDAKG